MKKALLVAVLALTTAFAAMAQPRAIGGRIGYGVEVSYQHNLGDNFLELDLGLPGWGVPGIGLTGIYDFVIAQPEWTPQGTWTFYAGPGVQVANWFGYGFYTGAIGVVGQVGLSYKFDFPLELSADLRPGLGFGFTNSRDAEGRSASAGFFYFDPLCFIPCLSVRYAF